MLPSPGPFKILLIEDAKEQLNALDGSVRERIRKRLERLSTGPDARTLRGHPDIWVLDIGDYRAFYLINEKAKVKTVFFIGDHKEYQRRYEKMFKR